MTLRNILEARDGWEVSIERLADLYRENGEKARSEASSYASKYSGRRATMVFDVVASRQRRYTDRVLPMVEKFEATPYSQDLDALASSSGAPVSGMQDAEWETIRNVAKGLLRFGAWQNISDEDDLCLRWAESTEELRFVHRLDPYVGNISGIGPALFAYLRMRSGAQGLKPDVRLKNAIRALGMTPPKGDTALLILCEELAKESGIELLVFDQLLWWLNAKK